MLSRLQYKMMYAYHPIIHVHVVPVIKKNKQQTQGETYFIMYLMLSG